MELIFATNNKHKIVEISELVKNKIKISGLSEAGFFGDIPEDYPTIEQNASQKSWFIYNALKRDCFSDDTGLEVEALRGAPGVYSARYSRMGSLQCPDLEIAEGNIKKLLMQMSNESNRNARFKTVISLIIKGIEYQFEGIIQGKISYEPKGKSGFGYDPVFVPDGYSYSFAEMELELKNQISHRALATVKLVKFLLDRKHN